MDDQSSYTPQDVKATRVRERWTRVYRQIQKRQLSEKRDRDKLALNLVLEAFHPTRKCDYRLIGEHLDEVMERLGKMLRSVTEDTPDQIFVVACETLERLDEWRIANGEGIRKK